VGLLGLALVLGLIRPTPLPHDNAGLSFSPHARRAFDAAGTGIYLTFLSYHGWGPDAGVILHAGLRVGASNQRKEQ
jgi:hypothetical protein